MKKIILILMLTVLILSVQDVFADGTCGSNVKYTVSGDTISFSKADAGADAEYQSDCTEVFRSNSNITKVKILSKMYLPDYAAQMFALCENVQEMDLRLLDTSNVQNMLTMFRGCSALTSLDISGWDTSNVLDMRAAFLGCSSLTGLDVSGWNIAKMELMGGLFQGCSSLNNLDVSGWDVSNLISLDYMFYGCSSLTSLDVSRWDTSNVTNLYAMFQGCSSLSNLDVSGWDTSNVENMTRVFDGCSNINSITFGKNSANTNVYETLPAYNETWVYKTQGKDAVQPLALNTRKANGELFTGYDYETMAGTWGVLEDKTCGINVKYTIDGDTISFSKADPNIDAVYQKDCTKVYYSDSNITKVKILNKLYLPENSSYMFTKPACDDEDDCNYEYEYVQEMDLKLLDVSNVKDMGYMFTALTSLKNLEISPWNTSNVTNMMAMFAGCSSLKTLDMHDWNTSNVTNMKWLFDRCTSLENPIVSSWNTSSVTDMSYMFDKCPSLTNLNLNSWDTSNVTDMQSIFCDCTSLTNLNVSQWNTANVTNMFIMFRNCSSLQSLDVSGWDTSNVTDMRAAFLGCSSLTGLDVSGWNIANMERMGGLFQGCSSLQNLDVSGWDVSNLISLDYMFYGCSSLTDLDVSKWDTSNVTNLYAMFQGCSSLSSLDVSGWDTSNVENMAHVFDGCSNMKSITFGKKSVNTNVYETLPAYNETWVYKTQGKDAVQPLALNTRKANGELFTTYDFKTMAGSWEVSETPEPVVSVFSIFDEYNNDLTGKTVELDAAAKDTLTLHVQTPDGSTPSVTWKSSAAKAASVSSSGLVKALKPGKTNITASYKDGKKTISATVTVKVVSKVQPGNITISGPESVAAGKTAKFTAKIGAQIPAPSVKTIVWVSSDTGKATINTSGVVTGKAATTTPVEISACAKDSLVNGKYTNCVSAPLSVTTAATAVTIEVIGGTTTLDAGETVKLQAIVSPAEASQEISWTAKSSKVAVVTINTDGTVTVKANAKGSVNIKATTTDGTKKSASIKLTVGVKVKNGMLDIKGAKDTLAVKKTMKLTAIFKPVPSNKKVEWSILEGADLITLKNGTVKAIAPGHAKVQVCSVENPSVCKSAEFDVISPVTSVKLDKNKAQTLDIGGGSETLRLKATVLPANATKPELEWKSSKTNVATVDENGVVTPVSVGSTVITASATDGSKKSAKLTVKVVSKVQDNSLEIVGDTHELGLKQTTTLKVKFNQAAAPANQKVTWKSDAPKTASVTAKGVVKGLKAGDATITATSADNKTVKATWLIKVSASGKADAMLLDEMPQETALPDIAALVDALLAETEEPTEEAVITETAEPTAAETEEPDTDKIEIAQTPEAVEETGEDEVITEEETTEPQEFSEEDPVIVEVIESEDEIAIVYESEDADSLMTEEAESGLDFGKSLIGSEPVNVVIRDLGEYDALSGVVNGVISITRDRFDLTDEVFSGLVFTVEDEFVAKLTEQSVDAGIELQLLNAGETKLIIKQEGSGEILREIRLMVTAVQSSEYPAEEELPAEEVLTESVETLESGELSVDEETIFVETEAELVFSNEPEP